MRYIQDPVTLELIPASEYTRQSPDAPFVMGDIEPYRSMATGEMIMGRRQHREHLRANHLIEIGNERQKPMQRAPDATVKRDVIAAVQRHWR